MNEPTRQQSEIRVVVVEDNIHFRQTLDTMLASAPQRDARLAPITVVGDAIDRDGVAKIIKRTQPHVVLLDLQIPPRSRAMVSANWRYGIEALKAIKNFNPATAVLVISNFGIKPQEYPIIYAARKAGMSGYLVKRDEFGAEQLWTAIRTVARGGNAYGATVRPLIRQFDDLTPREGQVYERIAVGKTINKIAEELTITPATVRDHMTSLFLKLQVSRREDLILLDAGDNPTDDYLT